MTSITRGQFPRHKIGYRWWKYTLPDGTTAAMRNSDASDWELYFRNADGRPIGETIRVATIEDGEQRITEEWRKRIAAAHEVLERSDRAKYPTVAEHAMKAASMVPDRIHFRLTRDHAALVSHPDAGPRFILALDNLTERDARSVLDLLRRETSRMLPQEVEFG